MNYQELRRYPPSLGADAPGPNQLPHGGRGPRQPSLDSYTARNFYVYDVSTTATLTNGTSTQLNITVDGDADFFWTKFNAFANVANDGTTFSSQELPGVTALIQNTTSGRNYSNQAVALASLAGTGQLPFILPQMTYWAAKTTIVVTLNNITDNKDYTSIRLSFIGIKAFP